MVHSSFGMGASSRLVSGGTEGGWGCGGGRSLGWLTVWS